MKVSVCLVLSTFILYCTLLQSRGVIVEGPQTVIFFPGQGPIELMCNASIGTTLWIVNDTQYTLSQLRNGNLTGHSAAIDGTDIIINTPTNNTRYVCVASSNLNDAVSETAFVYIAAVPERVPDFTGVASSTTLEGNMYNLTLSWGEPFNNFDPIVNYTVSCSGDVTCPPNFTTIDNTTRYLNVYNLNATIVYNFTVVANNRLGSGEPALFLTAPLTVPDRVTGVNLTCELSQSELYYNCTAEWLPVTMGNGPLELPLLYRVYYPGYFENVTSPTTYLAFRAPSVPAGYFVSNITVGVTAINRFGAGPPSENVSVEVMAPSVTEIIPTRLTDVPSNMYNYSFSCTIDPESSADTCEVTLRNGDITKMGSGPVVNGSATIKFLRLNCLDSYTVTAGGTLNGTLVGPRSSHGSITTGECMMSITPTTTSTMIVTASSTSVTAPEPTETTAGDGGAAVGTTCSIILVALTTLITMVI